MTPARCGGLTVSATGTGSNIVLTNGGAISTANTGSATINAGQDLYNNGVINLNSAGGNSVTTGRDLILGWDGSTAGTGTININNSTGADTLSVGRNLTLGVAGQTSSYGVIEQTTTGSQLALQVTSGDLGVNNSGSLLNITQTGDYALAIGGNINVSAGATIDMANSGSSAITTANGSLTLDGAVIKAANTIDVTAASLIFTSMLSTLQAITDGSALSIHLNGTSGSPLNVTTSGLTTLSEIGGMMNLQSTSDANNTANITNSGTFTGNLTSILGLTPYAASGTTAAQIFNTGTVIGSVIAGTDITNNGVITLNALSGSQTIQAGNDLILDGSGGVNGTGVILDSQGSGATAMISAGHSLEIGNANFGGIYKSGASGNLTVETTGNSSTLSINNSGSQISDASTVAAA